MEDYQFYQKRIEENVAKYKKNRDKNLYRNIKNLLDEYHIFLEENNAAQTRYDWLDEQQKIINQLKRQKQIQNTKKVVSKDANIGSAINIKESTQRNDNVGLDIAKALEEQVDKQLRGAERGIQKAIQVSAYIRIELDRQIELLDNVYEQNIKLTNRLKRVKQGLIVILRRIMLNKCTRFLAVLLVIAVIALIILYILRSQGKI